MGFIGLALEETAWLAIPCDPKHSVSKRSLDLSEQNVQCADSLNVADDVCCPSDALRHLPRSLICAQCRNRSGNGRLGASGSAESCTWFCQACWDNWPGEVASHLPPVDTVPPDIVPPDVCGRCGWGPRVARPPPFSSACESWLCPSCWLLEDAGTNPFRALDIEEYWLMQAHAYSEQSSPCNVQIAADSMWLEHCTEDYAMPWGPVTVIFDKYDYNCVVIVQALQHAFGSQILKLLDFHDREAFEALLEKHVGVPWVPLCRQGGLSAVLENGLFISECEQHPKVLLYELKYRKNISPAARGNAERIRRVYTKPLACIRDEFVSDILPHWWCQPEALALITTALAREKYVTIDGFLPTCDFERLRESCLQLHKNGQLTRGNRGHGKIESDIADLLNTGDRPRKWCMWDDNLTYCGDADARAVAVGAIYTCALDTLIRLLRSGGVGVQPEVAKRLEHVYFREKVMVACYRAETRGQYFQHVDSGGGSQRLLTAILYFNQDWTLADGGFNRMFHEGWFNTRVKEDILPIANRLLIFWADDDCPHEVTAVLRRDRYAMTVWYAQAQILLRERLGHAQGERELVEDFHPVAPYRFAEAAIKAIPGLERDRQLAAVAQMYEQRQQSALQNCRLEHP